ncbi:lipopolysaccharide biosynthesis protein, partial [uncultured Duncaniella sp.]
MSINRILGSSLVRNSFVYVVCDGINKAIPFLLLPFITYYLTPGDYGVVTNFNVYVQILSVFCFLCTAGALPVMFNKLDKSEIRSYVSNMMLLNTVVTFVCLIINMFIFRWIDRGLNISPTFQMYAIVVVWFTGITNINMLLWRCEERPVAFGVYQISQSAVNAATTVVFVIILLLGWQGRVYSMMCSVIVFGIISLYILYRRGYLEARIRKEFLVQTLSFAVPIIPHALSFWFRGGVEKILLTNMCDL